VRAFALTLVAAALIPSALEAGPWNRPKGGVYANVSFEYLSTTTLATPDGVEQEIPRYDLRQIGTYVEYGWFDRATLILDHFGFRESSIEDFESASGVEDTRAGLQWQIGRAGPWVLAARGILQFPTGDPTKGQGLLPTGSGAWEGDALFSMGRSSASGRVYGYGEAGYRARGEGLRDSFLYQGQFGVRVGRRTLLILNVNGVQPFLSEPGDDVLVSPSGLGDGTTYTVIGPGIIVEIGRGWGIQAEIEDAFNASNLATGLKSRIKVYYQR
jgi:hypothetical protein